MIDEQSMVFLKAWNTIMLKHRLAQTQWCLVMLEAQHGEASTSNFHEAPLSLNFEALLCSKLKHRNALGLKYCYACTWNTVLLKALIYSKHWYHQWYAWSTVVHEAQRFLKHKDAQITGMLKARKVLWHRVMLKLQWYTNTSRIGAQFGPKYC